MLEATSTAAVKVVSPVEVAHTIGARPHNSGPLLEGKHRKCFAALE